MKRAQEAEVDRLLLPFARDEAQRRPRRIRRALTPPFAQMRAELDRAERLLERDPAAAGAAAVFLMLAARRAVERASRAATYEAGVRS